MILILFQPSEGSIPLTRIPPSLLPLPLSSVNYLLHLQHLKLIIILFRPPEGSITLRRILPSVLPLPLSPSPAAFSTMILTLLQPPEGSTQERGP